MAPRKLYNFFIDPDLAAGLKLIKGRDGAPEGETLRRALRAYLEKKGAIRRQKLTTTSLHVKLGDERSTTTKQTPRRRESTRRRD
jgi:hypothetical protein